MAGIYIHIPFCKTRCIYCDFFSSVSMENKELYIQAVCNELMLRSAYLEGEDIHTIYFGGGTPSQLLADDFEKIFSVISSYYKNIDPSVQEITLEANPDDITPGYMQAIKRLPFNRISLGIQSFIDSELRFLNRRHNAESAIKAVKLCPDYGFSNISIDLMYGLPNQTMENWQKNLKQAIELNIQHISAYHLIYEEGTPIYKLLEKGIVNPIDDDLSVSLFEKLIDTLEESGFEHYEISNFAKKGYRSRHNSSYWDGTHYLGIGASAHSYNGASRQWNISSIADYIFYYNNSSGLKQKEPLPFETEIIDSKTAYNDFILTRLRTAEGINLEQLSFLFGEEKKNYCLRQAQKHIENQTLKIAGNHLMLTRKGIFISDGIMSDLIE